MVSLQSWSVRFGFLWLFLGGGSGLRLLARGLVYDSAYIGIADDACNRAWKSTLSVRFVPAFH